MVRFLVLALVVLAGCTTMRTPAPVTLPHSASMLVRSSTTGRGYRIWVALPDGYNRQHAPYPVLYAADANAEFFTVVEAARLAAADGEIPNLIVVGVGYDVPGQTIAAFLGPRVLDLTPSRRDTAWVRKEMEAAKAGGYSPPEGSGGAADFLRFLRTDLAPLIERTYHAHSTDRGWFGHSLGGLFGVYALLNGDGFFQRILAGSPSLGWDRRMMFAAESTFAKTHRALPARLFLSAGELEEKLITDMEAFATQLRAHNYEGLRLEVQRFPGEAHDSVIPAAISRGIRALYAK